MIQVFKFGGASVNSADAVRNVANIVAHHSHAPLLVVVSAMGKTTNALEQLVPGVLSDVDARNAVYTQLIDYHRNIIDQLFTVPGDSTTDPTVTEALYREAKRRTKQKVDTYWDLLQLRMEQAAINYNYNYDQTVSFGELISTTIIAEYLQLVNLTNHWVDVRDIVLTDSNYREGHVDWAATQLNVDNKLKPLLQPLPDVTQQPIVVTQGFIAGTLSHTTTTLGREGSDYSAAILSYCLQAQSMTIWKDVPGFLNADPKYFDNTVKIEQMPYNEAIEQAYYGASVIHPKTVKPLQNKNIILNIKSFVNPTHEGSVIGPFATIRPQCPLYIFKNQQTLLSIQPKDFSFIAEDNLQTIFAALAMLNIKVNLMQNSALSFSLCIDSNAILLNQLHQLLEHDFRLRYNEGLQLITIRFYTQDIIDQIVAGRPILLQQRSRTTTQLIVENLTDTTSN